MKKFVILVGVHGRPSMKKVYSQMQKDAVLKIRRCPPRKAGYIRRYEDKNINTYEKDSLDNLTLENNIVVRWGNRIEADTNDNTIVYNRSESVKKASDKKLTRQLLLEGRVRIPRLFSDQDYLAGTLTFPVIARPSVHAKGKNFVVLNDSESFIRHYRNNEINGWYYSEYVDKEREFRVHCAHGKVLAIMEKPKGDGLAWNRARVGEPFVRVKQEDYIYTVAYQALKATKVLGLDFAGVDVVLKTNEDGVQEAFVLEANTSPTLNSSEYVSNQYAKYFDWLASSDKRREHWDFTAFEKAKSLAWKQEQLLS